MTARGSATDPRVRADWAALRSHLLSFVRRRVATDEDAEDLVHDVLLRAQRDLDSLPAERADAWLYRVARNAIVDHYRRRGAASRHRDAMELLGPHEDALHDPSAGLPPEPPERLRHELGKCFSSLIDSLPSDQAAALRMTDLGTLSQAEAARALGIAPSTLKSRVQRGRAALRGRVELCCAVEQDARGRAIDLELRHGHCICTDEASP